MSDDLEDLGMTVQMNQFDRPTAQVDTSLQFTDLSIEPVIESESVEAQVRTCASVCSAHDRKSCSGKNGCV